MPDVVLRADGVRKHYGELEVLKGVSFEVDRGEVKVIIGPSGSGKSTLLSCLAGLDEPDGGMVSVAGERLSRRPEEVRASLRARHIGLLYQQVNLVGHLSVADNVAVAQRLAGRRSPPSSDVLERCAIAHRAGAHPSQLSGGELARAGLAVALANDPPVVLADEPTGELDEVTAERILDLLDQLAEAGTAALVVTHSPQVAARASREIRLRDGQVQS
jgi:putative ABC transport system ATP-binding protein